MFRQFLPDHGPEGLSRSDKALTALRGFMLLVLVVIGARIGTGYLAGAWLGGQSWWQTALGAVLGSLLGALVFVLVDVPAWISGGRQEAYEQGRAALRAARAAQQQATTRNAPPAGRGGRPPASRPAAPGRPGPARQAGRPVAAPPPAVAAVQVDERPPAPAVVQPSPELLEAVVKAVVATGPRGGTKQEIGDRLIRLGQDPTFELLTSALVRLADTDRSVSCVQDDPPSMARRWYDPAQLRVTHELLDQVVQVVTASGTDPLDVEAIRSGLLRLGVDPSAPALGRALRILVNDHVLLDAFGGYVRSGM